MAQYGGYGSAPPPAQPYGQPGYGQPAYGQPSYGQPNYGPPVVDPAVTQWFMAVDRDRSGRISSPELQQALTNANWSHFNEETCRLMIALFDRDRSGQIELTEFQALWAYIHQWKAIFDTFDRDRSGSIDANELYNAYNQMGYRMTQQFAQTVVYRYDRTGRQRLTLDNFIQSCVVLKSSTDMFRAKDLQQRGVIQIGYEEFVSAVMGNKI